MKKEAPGFSGFLLIGTIAFAFFPWEVNFSLANEEITRCKWPKCCVFVLLPRSNGRNFSLSLQIFFSADRYCSWTLAFPRCCNNVFKAGSEIYDRTHHSVSSKKVPT